MIRNRLFIDCLIFKNQKAFGYQEYLFNLLNYIYNNIKQLQFKSVVLLIPNTEIVSFRKYENKFLINSFDCNTKLKHLLCQMFIEKKINANKDDVVLFTYNYSSWFKKCKHILVIHDLIYLRKKLFPNTLMRYQRKIWVPISIRKADKIIAISNFTKKDIENNYKFSINKIEIIYNYFNFNKYSSLKNIMNVEQPYFLSICSTAVHKNTISVLKAFAKFCSFDDRFNLVLVGALNNSKSEAYKFYNNLDNKIKNRIILFKNISNEELSFLYSNASLFISMTLFEGLGMPIVEAMYFNIPLLLSNLDVCKEVSNNTGIYCDPFDHSVIAKHLIEFAKAPYKVETKELIEHQYSEVKTSKKYIDLLNNFS